MTLGAYAIFDGVDDYLLSPVSADFELPGDYTLEFKYVHSIVTKDQYLLDVHEHGNMFAIEHVDAQYLCFKINETTVLTCDPYAQGEVVGSLNNLTITRSGTTMYMFFNGLLVDSATGISGTHGSAIYQLKFGQFGYPGDAAFYGKMYGIRITKGVCRWTSAFTPPIIFNVDTGTKLCMNFREEKAATTFIDACGKTIVTYGNIYEAGNADSPLLLTVYNPNAYGTSVQDFFGDALAISGNYAVVGAYLEADAGGTSSGKVYVFNVTTGELLWTLSNPNAFGTTASDYFGYAVAISGNFIAIGAWQEDTYASELNSGRVYIFDLTTGGLLRTIVDPNIKNTSAYDYFGKSVALEGINLVVGAPGELNTYGMQVGAAYLFDVTTGGLLNTIRSEYEDDSMCNSSASLGFSVDISSEHYILGAPGIAKSDGNATAYIYKVIDNTLLHTIKSPLAPGTLDYFGKHVAISAKYAVISATYDSINYKVYIYDIITGSLLHTLSNPNIYGTPNNDQFGDYDRCIAISGDYVIVGAYGEDSASYAAEGKAYVFNALSGELVWTLSDPNTYGVPTSDCFGSTISAYGPIVIIAARGGADAGGAYSGNVHIYNLSMPELLTLPTPILAPIELAGAYLKAIWHY